jgi:enterochelin esterase-like enzyme
MKIWMFFVSIIMVFSSCKDTEQTTAFETEEVEADLVSIEFNEMKDAKLYAGQLMRIYSFPSSYIKERPVDVWLPENYSEEKKYAVLYMHDGQMLFDSTTTWNKQEWKVDEWASKLMVDDTTKDFIVVAIWNIANLRNSNYFPQKAFQLMSQKDRDSLSAVGRRQNWINTIDSDNYLKFIVQELKPYIDTNFSTLKDKDNTVIMGSSRGGLISLYAICEYPDIFGKAACLSTHWIGTYTNENNTIPEALFTYMNENLPDSETHAIYFDHGTKTLDEKYLPYQDTVNEVMISKGYTDDNFVNLKFEGADHSENAWSQRLDQPLTFLLGRH